MKNIGLLQPETNTFRSLVRRSSVDTQGSIQEVRTQTEMSARRPNDKNLFMQTVIPRTRNDRKVVATSMDFYNKGTKELLKGHIPKPIPMNGGMGFKAQANSKMLSLNDTTRESSNRYPQ